MIHGRPDGNFPPVRCNALGEKSKQTLLFRIGVGGADPDAAYYQRVPNIPSR